jgi:hypothetical protein
MSCIPTPLPTISYYGHFFSFLRIRVTNSLRVLSVCLSVCVFQFKKSIQAQMKLASTYSKTLGDIAPYRATECLPSSPNVYQSTWYNLPEAFNLEQHLCDTPKTHTTCPILQYNLFTFVSTFGRIPSTARSTVLLQKIICPQLAKNSPHFMEHRCSLLSSQQPAICTCPKPDQSTTCPPT